MPQVILNIFEHYGPAAVIIIILLVVLQRYVVKDFQQMKTDIETSKTRQGALEERLEKESRIREDRFKEIEGDVEMLKTESLHSLQLINQNIAGIQEVLKHHTLREERYQDRMDQFRSYVYKKLGPGTEDDK